MFKIEPKVIDEWYVVFEMAIRTRWYTRLLHKEINHCYIMKKSPGGEFWQIINPTYNCIDIDLRVVSTFPTAESFAGPYAEVIRVEVNIEPFNNSCQLGIISCVDVARRCLGIRSFRVQTPYQLFKYLRKVS